MTVLPTVLAQVGLGGAPVSTSTTAVPLSGPGGGVALETPPVDWSALMPLLVLFVGAVLLITVTSLMPRKPKGFCAAWTVITAFIAMATAVPLWARVQGWTDIAGHDTFLFWHYQPPFPGPFSAVAGAIGVDGFTVFATVVICWAVVLGALAADSYLRRESIDGPEFYVLMLISAGGGVILASANDLITVFLGLEILSIAVYVMAGMHQRRAQSQEAGLKYFVLGAFSTAFLLYGIAMIYGATGSTNLITIKTELATTIQLNDALLLLGFGLILVGLGFKVAAVPFHSWSPDVYDGSPTPAVVYMASAVKVAAFAGLVRVFVAGFGQFAQDWQPIIYALAVLSLVVGAVLGAVQTNVKRMLAYSSIAHAGFILVAMEAASPAGTAALLFYLAVYVFMVAGSFGVVALVARRGEGSITLHDYRGLSRTSPVLAGMFTLFLLAQSGLPFTTGFLAKFYTVIAAVEAGSSYLAIVAVLTSVISAFIYLRIIVAMYMTEGEAGGADDAVATVESRIPIPFTAGLGLVICCVVTLAFGFFPDSLTNLARAATPAIVQETEPLQGPQAPGSLTLDPSAAAAGRASSGAGAAATEPASGAPSAP